MDLHVQELFVLKLIWGNYCAPGQDPLHSTGVGAGRGPENFKGPDGGGGGTWELRRLAGGEGRRPQPVSPRQVLYPAMQCHPNS